ncbi:MAG: DUF1579 family protein [Pyrinomonadaceae bacterium]
MKILFTALFLTLVFAAAVIAQAPESIEAKKAEMKKLDKMAGQWKGSGWIQMGPKRETFSGSENVQRKLDGSALLIEGKFSNPEGRVIHETLAVLTYDTAKGYRFATYLANGMNGIYDFKIVPAGFEWGFQIPGGTIRYTINNDNDKWSEIGEFSKDGKIWFKTFEMTLDRVK